MPTGRLGAGFPLSHQWVTYIGRDQWDGLGTEARGGPVTKTVEDVRMQSYWLAWKVERLQAIEPRGVLYASYCVTLKMQGL